MFILSDAALYMSDFWVILVVALAYIINSYYFYYTKGRVFYAFLDYSDPTLSWLQTIAGLTGSILLLHIIISLIT